MSMHRGLRILATPQNPCRRLFKIKIIWPHPCDAVIQQARNKQVSLMKPLHKWNQRTTWWCRSVWGSCQNPLLGLPSTWSSVPAQDIKPRRLCWQILPRSLWKYFSLPPLPSDSAPGSDTEAVQPLVSEDGMLLRSVLPTRSLPAVPGQRLLTSSQWVPL